MERIKTKRLTMTMAVMNDLPELEVIERECDEYFRFDPPGAAGHNRSIRECITLGDIIPGVSQEDYRREKYCLYCIRKDNILIGWISFYLEYRQKDTVYLSVAYIKEGYRSIGVGTEIVDALASMLAAAQFNRIRLHCSLRDATALRFWVKNGFDRIIAVESNGNLYPENFGGIELLRNLSQV